MIGKTNLGGSGGGLNFKIVGGTEFPTGKDNLIWVDTSDAIKRWAISIEQPTDPVEGMVWIKDGNTNNLNILKKNVFEVCPSLCMQYVDGVWLRRKAWYYADEEWTQFSSLQQYLYLNGNTFTDVTGGWIKPAAVSNASTFDHGTTTVKFNASTIQISGSVGADHKIIGSVRTKNKIDLTPYLTLKVRISSMSGNSGTAEMGAYAYEPPHTNLSYAAGRTTTTAGTYVIDISQINEPCYIIIAGRSYNASATSSVNVQYAEVVLE